ncbi:MAG: hypothetical protein CVV52_17890 [Spirochaetae bacterium HGW-Spirochaetae-8]|nr:MAG: hypothetical protein CVV52_17890 [Spirochaetae bacterium HGW-Spirochaetae-8]
MKTIIIQFGGTGDLALKKLYPAYENLLAKGFDFTVLALGRRFTNKEDFLATMVRKEASAEFLSRMDYLYYDMADPQATDALRDRMLQIIADATEVELIYYMALQPSLYEEAIRQIQAVDSQMSCSCTLSKKIIVEKPFGFDLQSAERYNSILLKAFNDKEIYRVDHYLGKEFMQNLLILRFHNDIIRSIWDNRSIESIQIIFDETHGVDQRLGFYEQIGVVRDTIQNHIMQIITYLTMNEPATLSPEDIAIEKVKVLRSIAPVSEFHTGRYESLGAHSGHVVNTPTYAALKLSVNTYYFAGIPIYIRTGKMQKEAKSLIYVKFRNITGMVMQDSSIAENGVIITIHPAPAVNLGNDTAILPGQTVILNAGSGFTSYLWSTGATTQTINASSAVVGVIPFWVQVTDNNGCKGGDTIEINFTNHPGIAEATKSPGFSIVPNPASNQVEVLWDAMANEPVSLTIITLDGRMVVQKTLCPSDGKALLDVSALPAGNYLIQLSSLTNRTIQRLVIVR